ncbi:Serine--pyruvate aminotransferase, mitochondrial [Holothuria leucospilota]|uniref:Alanine--glyoxylate aminotransferase n=1 Tax=Holothuria leucospilota TaxID=206669 RepID=A0A9Q1CGR1_HOLLE|nr:Serine--pyruvate aminotransferase, mitochondrial [Holothuria leucospilota]
MDSNSNTEGQNDLTKEVKLFTPGPLGTSPSVKQAMLRDLGSRDTEMISVIREIRNKLVDIAGVSRDKFTCVPVQGSGTFAVEAVLNTTTHKDNARVLVLVNGSYGERMEIMCQHMGLEVHAMRLPDNEPISANKVKQFLQKDNKWSNIAIVHLETTHGLLNPLEEVGRVVREECPDAIFIADCMSSFGSVSFDVEEAKADFLVSSANKCLQGVPGFAYTICRRDKLMQCKGQSTSLALDLVAQYEGLERNGQFRFTPPTHCLLAFRQALKEFEAEGGVIGRGKRYKENYTILDEGMRKLGFKAYIPENDRGCVITSFFSPKHKNFTFEEFYNKLHNYDQVIYPGKTAKFDCFRIGNIGHLFPGDIQHLLDCISKVLNEMGVPTPVSC